MTDSILFACAMTYITVCFAFVLHLGKDVINEWLDLYSPKWYTDCVFCRGVEFGVILGMLLSYTVYLWIQILR